MNLGALGAGCLALLLAGCSSVVSRPQPFAATEAGSPKTPLTDGLTYWMPKRDVIVSITVAKEAAEAAEGNEAEGEGNGKGPKPGGKPGKKGKPQFAFGSGKAGDKPGAPKPPEGGDEPAAEPPAGGGEDAAEAPALPSSPVIKIGVTPSYADTSKAYVARFSRNMIGKNELTIEVNDRGLLSSAKSVTTSQLSDILTSLAGSAGAMFGFDAQATREPENCPNELSFIFRVDLAEASKTNGYLVPVPNHPGCNVKVKVTAPAIGIADNVRFDDFGQSYSGFFYKQNLPYGIEVSYSKWTAVDRVMLPNDAPVQFLPVEKSLFANNSSDLVFSDGVVKKYGQTVDGEFLALAKLPADVLKAYFEAIGSMFGWRKSAAVGEGDYLDAVLQLTKKQASTEMCLAAYRSRDATRIQTDCPAQ